MVNLGGLWMYGKQGRKQPDRNVERKVLTNIQSASRNVCGVSCQGDASGNLADGRGGQGQVSGFSRCCIQHIHLHHKNILKPPAKHSDTTIYCCCFRPSIHIHTRTTVKQTRTTMGKEPRTIKESTATATRASRKFVMSSL